MCFNQPMTITFSVIGFLASIWVYYRSRNIFMTMGCFYFFLMEFLQVFQYIWIDQCDSWINKVLTALGVVHIVFQPFFGQLIAWSDISKKDVKAKAIHGYVLKTCLIGGVWLLLRFVFGMLGWFTYDNVDGFLHGYNDDGSLAGSESVCGRSTEWVRGKDLCTFSGRKHLGWSIPMASPSYFMPGVFTHFFLMFIPFFLSNKRMNWVYGTLLLVFGPILSYLITDDLMEQASIWCFFSISQVVGMCLFAFFYDPSSVCFYHGGKEEEKEEKEK